MATEAWLRGPIDGVPPLLMPAAHALTQAAEDARAAVAGLSATQVWARPGGAASVGFHLRHIAGATDRLFTYARDEQLDDAQRAALAREGEPGDPPEAVDALLDELDRAVAAAIDRLRDVSDERLLDARGVGRARLPSTVLGLLFHAAEHAQRHAGQVIATAKVVRAAG